MPKVVNGNHYYTIHEVCSRLGISKSTLSRRIKKDPDSDAKYRDRNGWRLYSEDEIERLNEEYNRLYPRQNIA
jgi:IS30 family transposase